MDALEGIENSGFDVGSGRPGRNPVARRARCRRDQGGAPGGRSLSLVSGLPGVEPQPPVRHARPEEPRRQGALPRAGGHRRRGCRELPARRHGGARPRLRVAGRAVSPARVRLDTGLSLRQPPGVAPRLGRPGAGSLGPAVGAARLAPRTHLLAQSVAQHRRAVPRADGHPGCPARPVADRPGTASRDIPVPGRSRIHRHAVGVRRAQPGNGAGRYDQDISARGAPGRGHGICRWVDPGSSRIDPEEGGQRSTTSSIYRSTPRPRRSTARSRR